jgi:hypothetical protein
MTREKRRKYTSPYAFQVKEQQRLENDMADYKLELYAFWNKEGTVRPTSYKMPFKHNSKWRNALDIDYWTDARSQPGQALQTETDKLFESSSEDPYHPNVFVTLGLCKMVPFRTLTQEGEQVHKLFSATYWDEQGHYFTSLNRSEQDLDVSHDNLCQCAAISLQRIHQYSLEAVTSWYSITPAVPGPQDSNASTIMDEEDS